MRGTQYIAIIGGALFAVACSSGQAAESQPKQKVAASPAPHAAIVLTGRVTDAAGIISPAQEARLTDKLEQLERDTRHQMVVVTAPTLAGQDVASFTLKLANAWGIGRKGYNDGVVLLIAPKEGKARIEIGRGLEQRLPNALCEKIMAEQIIPLAQKGDLSAAIEAGTDALIARLKG